MFSFGQNEKLNQIYVDWENPKNFEKYNVKKVTVYSKEIKKNGNAIPFTMPMKTTLGISE